jgi:hypothetical protein
MNDARDNAQTDREMLERHVLDPQKQPGGLWQTVDPEVSTVHIGLSEHDGYAPHSHEARSDHLGVDRPGTDKPTSRSEPSERDYLYDILGVAERIEALLERIASKLEE